MITLVPQELIRRSPRRVLSRILSRIFGPGQKEGYSIRKALRRQDVELLGQ
jgi:hypothetical protein